jgi:spermidine synthase
MAMAVTAAFLLSLLCVNKHLIGYKPESYKYLATAYDPGVHTTKVEATAWTPITRIDLWSDSARDVVFSRPSPDAADSKMITQDGDAFTLLWGPHRVAEAWRAASRAQAMSAVSLTYRLNKKPKDSLIIGVGGGLDMVTAKAYGAENVTGVEINPATVALVLGPYRDFLQWPKWDGVTLVRAEGRNYLRSKRNAYDTIVMSGVDTFSALNSGAYVLSENYLYTVEAMEDYLRSLKQNGTATIFRWFFFRGPRESLRLANMFQVAAERLGIAHPEQCIMVISEDQGWSEFHWAATFVKKRPFTPAEVQEVAAAIANDPRRSFVYMPKVFPPDIQAARERTEAERDPSINFARSVYNRLLNSTPEVRSAFVSAYPFRIDPVYDDRPFFFEYYKPGAHTKKDPAISPAHLDAGRGAIAYYVLYFLLALCAIICFTCILGPLWVFERRGLEVAGSVPLLLYFACLGAGYMTFELGAMQVLNVYLGDPAYSLALVLAGLLVASGVGAALSSKLSGDVRVISFAATIVAAVIVLWLAWTSYFTARTMQLPLVARGAATLVCLFPVGILLGIPFPTAVKALEKRNRSFIAWAWGVNGVTSVLASIVAIVVAMRVGFKIVVCIAAATYILAMLSYRWHTRALKS